MTANDLPRVLDVDETAGVLRVSKWSVYEAVKRGDIRALRVGKCLRISRAEVLRLLGEVPENSETGA